MYSARNGIKGEKSYEHARARDGMISPSDWEESQHQTDRTGNQTWAQFERRYSLHWPQDASAIDKQISTICSSSYNEAIFTTSMTSDASIAVDGTSTTWGIALTLVSHR